MWKIVKNIFIINISFPACKHFISIVVFCFVLVLVECRFHSRLLQSVFFSVVVIPFTFTISRVGNSNKLRARYTGQGMNSFWSKLRKAETRDLVLNAGKLYKGKLVFHGWERIAKWVLLFKEWFLLFVEQLHPSINAFVYKELLYRFQNKKYAAKRGVSLDLRSETRKLEFW